MSTHEQIMLTVDDMIADFLFYDRKEDDELPRGAIEQALAQGDVTIDDIVERFRTKLTQGIRPTHESTLRHPWGPV